MKKLFEIVPLLSLALCLSGCFQVDQVVTLLPNGSGTVEETFRISRKIAGSMAALTGGMGETGADAEKGATKTDQSFFKDDEIKKRAALLGTDVKLVKMERLVTEQFEGYKAVYSFGDINKLRIDQGNPGMPREMGNGGDANPTGIEFVFKPGKTAKLVVKQPKKHTDARGEAVSGASPVRESTPEELAMIRQMFGGLRISTSLVIKGKVVESNATHRTGSTIVIADVDFGKILDKPELLSKMAALQGSDQAAAMEMIKNFPGMKVDMNEVLWVNFR